MRINGTQWLLVLLTAMLAGCGTRHFTYRSDAEIPDGPGMFSGNEGAFVLYSDREAKAGIAEVAPAIPANGPSVGPTPTGTSPARDSEFGDFQEFRRWKKTNRVTPEYREFREWREWKAYRAWQERQK